MGIGEVREATQTRSQLRVFHTVELSSSIPGDTPVWEGPRWGGWSQDDLMESWQPLPASSPELSLRLSSLVGSDVPTLSCWTFTVSKYTNLIVVVSIIRSFSFPV